ncbi:hypothetical protein [Occallatibacter riparius]|uniref:Uncharacterized protein n=1 Tax=Occallatibacter riparius TaxID=1002689 RepID=A0A9J7BTX1_9BACT|nr:hypothetical protein [Occallatibacter riparius]UWZ86324.1 hypothetical protein MOP44_10345 [Occallatibacter riparius]
MANVWKLSYAELAHVCQVLGDDSSAQVSHEIREEARILYAAWKDALAIDLHQEGAATRQASMMLGLRKRTIELLFKSGVAV